MAEEVAFSGVEAEGKKWTSWVRTEVEGLDGGKYKGFVRKVESGKGKQETQLCYVHDVPGTEIVAVLPQYTYVKSFGADKRLYVGNICQIRYGDGRMQLVDLPLVFRDKQGVVFEIAKPDNFFAIGGGLEPSNDY